ncbi:MAG: c-type cytochrome [Verrucomicrobiales bacterium]|nr:c-type cytochrome [Verrucomicrobiales bacterium]
MMKRFTFLALSLFSAHALYADSVPDDLVLTHFAGPELTPSPACLCAAEDGSVYAGIDLNGSLGKGTGKGRIIRLVDTNKDGVADEHTLFAPIDNPRGLIAVGDQLFVLHTAYDEAGASTGMDLVVLTDADRDGVADGPARKLVEHICSGTAINNRGTDHSTNGIQLGIDGWIYVAVGDFGFADAIGSDGKKLTLLGGGIVRVRPDGTEMELYTTGMRNIYDVAIDPFMNIFTRGNTNDGGGWNVRFNHHIQSGEYGYPRLFVNFAEEIIPALEDLGGGSGVGALFLDEATWPDHYNKQPLMADWGRKAVYLHRLEVDGATFQQKQEDFVFISQITDLDVDPSGQMFLSAWDGAGFKGDETKGYVVRVVPKDWTFEAAPDFAGADLEALVALLRAPSDKTRLYAQQELLSRDDSASALSALQTLSGDESVPLESRVAALYTFAQIENDPAVILAAGEGDLREFALRAATDRLSRLEGADLSLEPFVKALHEGSPREKAAAAIALGRLENKEASEALLAVQYQKPARQTKAVATQLNTVKGGRRIVSKLVVEPGEKLYLNLAETNLVEEASQLALIDGRFALADGSSLSLSSLKPVSGDVFVNQNPDGSALSKKATKSADSVVTMNAPATIVYEVPDNAVNFETEAMKADSCPREGSIDFYVSTVSPDAEVDGVTATPRHSTPNSEVIVPHLSARALIRIGDVESALNAVGTSSEDLALWALSYLHSDAAVEGLLEKLDDAQGEAREKILTTLARLYQEEAPYDGSWWWTTRPDTRGPYYKPVAWDASAKIAAALNRELEGGDEAKAEFLASLNDRMRMGIEELGTLIEEESLEAAPTVDLAKIRSKKGAVGSTPIEDVILSLDKIKGDGARGEALFTQQGCVACHALTNGGVALGPYMGQIGSIMNREQIATAILRPNDTISQGFQTAQVKMKDGSVHLGFVTESDVDKMTLRDMAGQVTTLKTADVEHEEHLPTSMMPPGLANALSLEEFADLVTFLASKKG